MPSKHFNHTSSPLLADIDAAAVPEEEQKVNHGQIRPSSAQIPENDIEIRAYQQDHDTTQQIIGSSSNKQRRSIRSNSFSNK